MGWGGWVWNMTGFFWIFDGFLWNLWVLIKVAFFRVGSWWMGCRSIFLSWIVHRWISTIPLNRSMCHAIIHQLPLIVPISQHSSYSFLLPLGLSVSFSFSPSAPSPPIHIFPLFSPPRVPSFTTIWALNFYPLSSSDKVEFYDSLQSTITKTTLFAPISTFKFLLSLLHTQVKLFVW